MSDPLLQALKASIGEKEIAVPVGGHVLLDTPLVNKGEAFSEEERSELGLHGLLPPDVLDMETQLQRVDQAIAKKPTPLEKYIYLRALQDTNEVLYFRYVVDRLTEIMPIIYTPTVGLACQQFSEIFRRPRGLYISYPNRDRIDEMLAAAPVPDPKLIVVTDGQRILGLGDQGAGGMGIPIGKLSLYTGCGGIDPGRTLPIQLDVGTDNPELLANPEYIGWRHRRIADDEYYAFFDRFVEAVEKAYPGVMLQFEDFALPHALPLLERYRDKILCFNDDIQGTAAVAVSTVLSASRVLGRSISDQNVVMVGAGSAGCGIAELIVLAMRSKGLSEAEARARVFMVDRNGLVIDDQPNLTPAQKKLAHPRGEVAAWSGGVDGTYDLASTVTNAKAGILIGVAGVPGLFTEKVIRQMAANTDRPVILPLSNPTSRAEGIPHEILEWTGGTALIATGSPFDPVERPDGAHVISQCNNSYIFPGIGLGVLTAGIRRVTDEMFLASAEALAAAAAEIPAGKAALLPPLSRARDVSIHIAAAVAEKAIEQGHADPISGDFRAVMKAAMWQPDYKPVKRK